MGEDLKVKLLEGHNKEARLPSFCGILGFTAGLTHVVLKQKMKMVHPLHNFWRGIPTIIGWTVIGCLMNSMISRKAKANLIFAEEYAAAHPEDFPEEQPLKYKNVFYRWEPLR